MRKPARRLLLASALFFSGMVAGPALASPGAESAEPCRRIIALAPSAAELLFALDLGDRVVGVGDWVRWPEDALEGLPRLGGLVDPHREEIVALAPDLAVLLPSEADLGRQLRSLGIDTLEVPSETVDDVAEAARRIAARCPAADGEWIARFREALAPRPVAAGIRVLLVVDRRPGGLANAVAAGPGTFYDELLGRLGAENVLDDASVLYPRLDLEQVLARDPDVILELQAETPDAGTRQALVADWERLGPLSAVRAGRVVAVGGSHVLVPGPRLPLLYERFAEILTDAEPEEP